MFKSQGGKFSSVLETSKDKKNQETPLHTGNIWEIHCHKGKQNKWSKQIEFSVESNQFNKKSKVGINEMYSNC